MSLQSGRKLVASTRDIAPRNFFASVQRERSHMTANPRYKANIAFRLVRNLILVLAVTESCGWMSCENASESHFVSSLPSREHSVANLKTSQSCKYQFQLNRLSTLLSTSEFTWVSAITVRMGSDAFPVTVCLLHRRVDAYDSWR
jgi:hypothetical protein